jgi:non-specific serine/threonine protein kinase
VLGDQRAAALAQYETCRKALKSELGVEPSVETVRLYERIRAGEVPGAVTAKPKLHNLPVQLTRFVGREQAIEQVRGLLEKHRLVTIAGPGGIGKTRLAIQVTGMVAGAYQHGAFFVDLAVVREPGMVIPAIVNSLEMYTETPKPLVEVLLDFLQYRHTLLVLDNCEHVIATCAKLVEDILRRCADVRLLATSRETLGVEGEAVYQLSPMVLPEEKKTLELPEIKEAEAVQFFQERAQSLLPGFDITDGNAHSVAAICHQLDGIPLALELAAARLQVLSVEQIRLMLTDRFKLLTRNRRGALPRQQTLQASIEWSHSLLTNEEQILYRRLSVFSGGCSLEGAQWVCEGDGLQADWILDLLDQLVSKSLLMVEKGETYRYRMLETIRQYAHHKLVEAGELTAYRDRHLDYFTKLSADFSSASRFWDELITMHKKLDPEIPNLRLALTWVLVGEDFTRLDKGIQIGNNLFDFWHNRDMGPEILEIRRSILEMLPSGEPRCAVLRARECVMRETPIYSYLGIGINDLEESLETFRAQGDSFMTSQTQLAIGYCKIFQGQANFPEVRRLVWDSIEIMRRIGNKILLAETLFFAAHILRIAEGETAIKPLLDEGLALADETGNTRALIYLSFVISELAKKDGDYLTAKRIYQEQLDRDIVLNCRHGVAEMKAELGKVSYFLKDYSSMEAFLQEAVTIATEIGMDGLGNWAGRYLGLAFLLQSKFDQARKVLLESIEIKPEENLLAFGLTMIYLGGIYLEVDRLERAFRLLGFGESLLEEKLKVLDYVQQAEYSRIMTLARERLSDPHLAAIWEEGRKMTLEQAVQYAQEEQRI